MPIRASSSTIYLLKALVPYTEANLKLTYKPNSFFNELEKQYKIKKPVFKNSFKRLQKRGLIQLDDRSIPRLTAKGERKLAPYTSKKLKGAQLMVIFDIPEHTRWQRNVLRTVLHEFKFAPIQKSVWITDLDCRKYIEAEIEQHGLREEVKLFEVRSLS